MKSNRLLKGWVASVLGVLTSGVFAGPPPAMQDVMTYEQVALARRKADLHDPMKDMQVIQGEDPSVVNRPKSLLAESDIVSFGKFATLVPKRAILQIPKNYAGRIRLLPGVTLQSWEEFYAANRGWITTVEVSRIQAEGKLPIAEEIKTQMTKSGNLVVATYLGGPISVLPPKAPEQKTPEKAIP